MAPDDRTTGRWKRTDADDELISSVVDLGEAIEQSHDHLASAIARSADATQRTVAQIGADVRAHHERTRRILYTIAAVLSLLLGSSSVLLARGCLAAAELIAPPPTSADSKKQPPPKPTPRPAPRPAPPRADGGVPADSDRDAVVPDELPAPLWRWINCDGSPAESVRDCPSAAEKRVNP